MHPVPPDGVGLSRAVVRRRFADLNKGTTAEGEANDDVSSSRSVEEEAVPWTEEVAALVSAGYDQVPAWLNLVLDKVGTGKPLGELTNERLRDFGRGLNEDFYPGLPDFFEDVTQLVKQYRDISVEFYIISGGLKQVIEGSAIVARYFRGVYGSELEGETAGGILKRIKRCVTFTEKTRYLFEINKGVDVTEAQKTLTS